MPFLILAAGVAWLWISVDGMQIRPFAAAWWILHHPGEWMAAGGFVEQAWRQPLAAFSHAVAWMLAGWAGMVVWQAVLVAGTVTLLCLACGQRWTFWLLSLAFLAGCAPLLAPAQELFLPMLVLVSVIVLMGRRPSSSPWMLLFLALVLPLSGPGALVLWMLALTWTTPLWIKGTPVGLALTILPSLLGLGAMAVWFPVGIGTGQSVEQWFLLHGFFSTMVFWLLLWLGAVLAVVSRANHDRLQAAIQGAVLILLGLGVLIVPALLWPLFLHTLRLWSLGREGWIGRLQGVPAASMLVLLSVTFMAKPSMEALQERRVELGLASVRATHWKNVSIDLSQSLTNQSALLELVLFQPGMVGPEWLDFERPRRLEALRGEPTQWRGRGADRDFEEIWLAGTASGWSPFLQMLLRHPAWRFEEGGTWGVRFVRGGESGRLEERFHPVDATARTVVRGILMSRGGEWILAMGDRRLSKAWIDEGLELAGSTRAEPWVALARWEGRRENWPEAVAAAGQALNRDGNSVEAWTLLTRALLRQGEPYAAYPVSRRAVSMAPGDPHVLFTHAAICREVNARQEEIQTLQVLVTRGRQAGAPVTGYLSFMAQAHAAVGELEAARAVLEEILDDPDAAEDQREFARQGLHRLELEEAF